jgi:hypothetical protein
MELDGGIEEDPVELPPGEPASGERAPEIHGVDDCDPRVLADEHVEHRLAGVDSGVAFRSDQFEVEDATRSASQIKDVRRVLPAHVGKQVLDVFGLTAACRVLGIPDGGYLVERRLDTADR